MIEINKQEIIEQFKLNDKDTGSCEVQVALLTARIRLLTQHLQGHRKDFHSRRGLIAMTNHRRKLLSYIKRRSLDDYAALVKSLGLRK